VRALRKLSRLGCFGTLCALGKFAVLIAWHSFAIRTIATIAVATTTTTTTTWRIFAILDGAAFSLWREQIRLNRIVVKTSYWCG
jgi:hypothetical protein